MAIDSKNLLVWVKAMSRGQALPLDASEIHSTLAEAENYASTSAIAYPGQTVKAMTEDGKYHTYTLQPSEAGYVLEEVGAIDESGLKQYVQVVDELPESGQIEGVLYLTKTNSEGKNTDYSDGYIWVGSAWKHAIRNVDHDIVTLYSDITVINSKLAGKAPIENPVFTGTVKIGEEEVAVKSYVDGLISNLESKTPMVLDAAKYALLVNETDDSVLDADTIKAGVTFRVAEAGAYFKHRCEVGDLILCLETPVVDEPYVASQFMVIQANIDGAVTSTADATTVGEIVVFDSVTGKVIRGSGIQIASLNDAVAKAHEHSNKTQLDTYDKTQAELLEAAKTEAQGLVNTLSNTVDGKLANKADKATTLAGYGITDAYNKTEIDASLKTVTDNLNTKTSSAEVDNKIAAAKTEILDEAAAAADAALKARVGDIPEDTTIQSYIDTAVGSGGTASAQAIATAKQEAIDTSKAYTDNQIVEKLTVIEF